MLPTIQLHGQRLDQGLQSAVIVNRTRLIRWMHIVLYWLRDLYHPHIDCTKFLPLKFGDSTNRPTNNLLVSPIGSKRHRGYVKERSIMEQIFLPSSLVLGPRLLLECFLQSQHQYQCSVEGCGESGLWKRNTNRASIVS